MKPIINNQFPAGWTGSLTTADLDSLMPASIPANGDPLFAELRIEVDDVSAIFVEVHLFGGDHFYGSASAIYISNSDGWRQETVLLEDPGTSDSSQDAREAIATACDLPEVDDDDDSHAEANRLLVAAMQEMVVAMEG